MKKLTKKETQLINFLEWLDCSREILPNGWKYPDESHMDTVRKYLNSLKEENDRPI